MSPTEPGARQLQVLSPEQHALLGLVCEEWLGVGLATGPADRAAAEQGVRLAYQATGLSPPGRVVWLGSPLAGTIAAAMLWVSDLTDHAPDGSWRALHDQLRASLWVQPTLGLPQGSEGVAAEWFGTPAGRQVQAQVAERVRLAVMDEVSTRLGSPAWETLSQVVENAVSEQLRELALPLHELIGQVLDPVVTPLLADEEEVAAWEFDGELPDPLQAVGGQHDVDWLTTAAALPQLVPGTLDAPGLDGLMQVARSAGWWWPFEHLVVLTERPGVCCVVPTRDAAAEHRRAGVLRPQATLAVRPTLRGLVRPGAGISCWAWAAAGERLTSPLTVGSDLPKRRSAQR
jgi:hypothetical protein